MSSDRRSAGTFALAALTAVVALIWFAAQDDVHDGASGSADENGENAAADAAGALAADGGSAAPGGAKSAAARRPRKRAYVRTDEDVQRDAAREALVAEVAQAATNVGAANVRAMVLPGTVAAAPVNWPGAEVRLGGAQPGAAVIALDALPRRDSRWDDPRDSRDDGRIGSQMRTIGGGVQRVRTLGGGLEDDWGNPVIPAEQDPKRYGLRADYFDFLDGELLDVPDLASLPPSLTRVDPSVDFATDDAFALPFVPETFGALWRGYVVVETAGTYTFAIGSDDGARLRIDDTTVVEYTDLRPYAETTGEIHLDAGRHTFELGFYENYIFASCRLFWTPPGATERTIVPASAFAPPDEIAAVDPPVVLVVSPWHGRIGDEVVITGRGFSATPTLERVTFDGVPAEIVDASPTALTVKVPIGAATGNVVVQVGPLSTRPVPFEVDNLLGLYGEYFLIGTELTDMPAFDSIAPYFVRLDGPIDFNDDGLWQMPYDPDVFAARWFGFLYVPEEDEYEIALLSDDGAFVMIDGTKVVDLPGLHPPMEASKVVALTAGFHPIEMHFFENYGLARMSLSWRRKGEPTRVPIPRGFLFAPDALATRAEPVITSMEPPTAVSGDEIVLHGANLGTDMRTVRVVFPGEAWVRPTFASDDLLRVRVPYGAGSGDLRVHVGVRVSAAATFTLGEPIGLRGDYFELAAGEAPSAVDLPALLAARTPAVSRIDTRWRFQKRADWDLPFATRDFAVRWSGTIEVETAQSLNVSLQSESAALLRVDGQYVVGDIEIHSLREVNGGGELTRGQHSIELFTLHRTSAPQLHIFLTPWGRADHLELPPTWLRPREPMR